MVRQKKLAAKPAGTLSLKKKIALGNAKTAAPERTPKASTQPSPEPPFRLGQILKPAQFKAEADTSESPYADRMVPLIACGKASRAAQKRGVEANMKTQMLQKERFLSIFREIKAAAGVRPQKKNLVAEAVAKFNRDHGKLSERTAWNYLKGFD